MAPEANLAKARVLLEPPSERRLPPVSKGTCTQAHRPMICNAAELPVSQSEIRRPLSPGTRRLCVSPDTDW
jgi:hypothetical protein